MSRVVTLLAVILAFSLNIAFASNYEIDVENQSIKFTYSHSNKTSEHLVAYEAIRDLFPEGVAPEKVTSEMIFNPYFVLKTLDLIKDGYIGTYSQGDLMAELKVEDTKVNLYNYRLQYLQFRPEFYSPKPEFAEKYTNYFGDHVNGKPSVMKYTVGSNEDQVQFKLTKYKSGNSGTTHLEYTSTKDEVTKTHAFKLNNIVNAIGQTWKHNFIKKNTNLISYTESDPLFKWRLIYEDYAGVDNGPAFLECETYKCFKKAFHKTKSYKHEKVKDVYRLLKYNNDVKKKKEFRKLHVPLLLSVSKQESAFYKNIADMQWVLIEVDMNNKKVHFLNEGLENFISVGLNL